MFESDDFDQVLSQFDFPEVDPVKTKETKNINNQDSESPKQQKIEIQLNKKPDRIIELSCNTACNENIIDNTLSRIRCDGHSIRTVEKTYEQNETDKVPKFNTPMSPKHTKRKLINSHFDHKSKRKFPGPAGLLTGAFEKPEDDNIYKIELLSQDIDCTSHLRSNLFNLPIWKRLQSDTNSWKLHDVESIKMIKQQALPGHLRRRKAQTVTAFVESVDRSAIDPMIILRDATGTIKCTLHRDAWSTFSHYIVSEYCALVLQKPTVLTTGAAFKKHYLNITLSNILAIYSSAVLNEDNNKTLPDGYSVVDEEEFTVIRNEKCSRLGTSLEQNNSAEDLFDQLESIFSDEIF